MDKSKKGLYDRNNAENEFKKALDDIAYRHSLWDVFQDFLDFSLLMLRWWDIKPEMFAHLEKKYTRPEEHALFAKAYTAMGDIAMKSGPDTGFKTDKTDGFHDPFGNYFMENFGNSHIGQFFTPETVSEFMAEIMISDDTPAGQTVLDCACGSGRTLLSAARRNRNLIFYAADIDINCVKMTTINFLLNSMQGEVAHMDSLSLQHWKSYRTHRVLHEGYYLPYYTEHGAGETEMAGRMYASMADSYKKEGTPKPPPLKKTIFKKSPEGSPVQTSLFS